MLKLVKRNIQAKPTLYYFIPSTKDSLHSYYCQYSYQLVRNFQLRAELIKITSFERAQKTEQEYQIFSKTYAQVPSKNFLK